ncbi:MAG: caspase domain-containing protein [Sphingomonas sp.]
MLGTLSGLLAPAIVQAQGGGGPGGPGPGGGPQGPAPNPQERASGDYRGSDPMQRMDELPSPQPPRINAFIVSQSYRSTPAFTLANTTRDAALMSRSFQRLRFDAVSALVDADPQATLAGIADYLRTVDANTIALVYVAGHGVEIAGENLLMLEGANAFLSLQSMVQTLRERAGLAILFLDACRNNPLAGEAAAGGVVSRTIGGATGDGLRLQTANLDELRARAGAAPGRLRPFMLQGSGIKIVFSTDPSNVAFDGVDNSRNSPFAQALARYILRPISLDDIVSLTTGEVLRMTRRRQSPWSQGSIDRPIFLSGPRRRLQSSLSGA